MNQDLISRQDKGWEEDKSWEEWEQRAWQGQEELDPLVIGCGNPDCIMPGPHMLSECHTAADYEAYFQEEINDG